MQELDRVLDRDDVVGARPVDLVDQRGQRRRLTGAGGAGEQDEAARLGRELVHARRQAELLERADVRRDEAEGAGERPALVIGVDTEAGEPAQAVGEVERAVDLEPLLLLRGRDAIDELARHVRVELGEVLEQLDVPMQPHRRLRPGGEMQVGRVDLADTLEQRVDRERRRAGLIGVLHGASIGRHPHRLESFSENPLRASPQRVSASLDSHPFEGLRDHPRSTLLRTCGLRLIPGFPASEDGFTLIELLVVLVIIAVLIAIAVPSYLGFKGRAADRAAQANLRATLPSAEAYYSDGLTYVGMTPAALRSIDAGLSPSVTVISVTDARIASPRPSAGEPAGRGDRGPRRASSPAPARRRRPTWAQGATLPRCCRRSWRRRTLTHDSPANHSREGSCATASRTIPGLSVPLPGRSKYMLLSKLQRRIQRDEGFTLIELLVVLVIIAVLLAIAVPSYLGFKERAEKRAAQSNIRAAIPAAEAFYSDNGDYVGISNTVLRRATTRAFRPRSWSLRPAVATATRCPRLVGKCRRPSPARRARRTSASPARRFNPPVSNRRPPGIEGRGRPRPRALAEPTGRR